jgi:hypothetical protein
MLAPRVACCCAPALAPKPVTSPRPNTPQFQRTMYCFLKGSIYFSARPHPLPRGLEYMFRIDRTEERRCRDFKPTDSILRIVRRSSKTEAHGGESPPPGIYSRDQGRMGSEGHPARLAEPGRYCNLQRGGRLCGNSNFAMYEGRSSDVCRSRRSLLSLPACKPRRIGFLASTDRETTPQRRKRRKRRRVPLWTCPQK